MTPISYQHNDMEIVSTVIYESANRDFNYSETYYGNEGPAPLPAAVDPVYHDEPSRFDTSPVPPTDHAKRNVGICHPVKPKIT